MDKILRPIDRFVERSQNILQKEYVVIGKRRVSSFTAWAVIAFFVGITVASAFLASRSGTLEGSQAARAPRPVWSNWGNWKEGSAPLDTSTLQYRQKAKTSIQVVNGRRTRTSMQGYEERQCVKNCESLVGAQFQQQGQQQGFNEQSLKERKARLLTLAATNPKAFLSEMLLKPTRDALPANLKNLVEQEIDFTTKIDVLHEDDFKNRIAKYFYFLRSGTKRFQFYPDGALPPLRSGATVRIKGFQLENSVVASVTPQNFQIIASAPAPVSVGVQKTAVLLINFLDSPAAPLTKEQVDSLVFTGALSGYPNQMQKFYQEQSYGKVWWAGDVFGWYTLQRKGYHDGYCQIPSPSDEDFKNLILANNINLANYSHLVIVPNSSCGANDSFGTVTVTINGVEYTIAVARTGISVPQLGQYRDNPFDWTYFDALLSHELGHNLGVLHANSWECGAGKVLYGECVHQEYGNWFDVMGTGVYATHFNALYKDTLKWLDTSSLLTITGSGRYTLQPFENNSGVRAAKIQPLDSTTTPFYLEYRQPIGFDANLNDADLISNTKGLMVNWNLDSIVGGGGFSSFIPRLLDMSPVSTDPYPGGSTDWQEVTLNSGMGVFKDPGKGITIGPVINANNSGITFDVIFGEAECVRKLPTIADQSILIQSGSISFFDAVLNADYSGCGPSNFQISLDVPTGWSSSVGTPTFTLDPEKTFAIRYSVTPPLNVTPGEYIATVNIANQTSGQSGVFKRIKVKIDPPIKVISPNGGEKLEKGKMYDIKWTANSAGTQKVNSITIDLYKNDIKFRNLFGPFANDSLETWTIPEDISTAGDYKIGITFCPEETKCSFDLSDGTFSITPPVITICNDGNTYEITSSNSIYEPRTRKPTSYIIPGGSIKLGLKNLTTGAVDYGGSYNFVSNKPDKVVISPEGNIATDIVKKYNDYDLFIDISIPDLSACKNVIQPMRVMVGDPFLGNNIAFIYPKSIIPAQVLPSGQPWATISVDQMMKDFDFVRITDLAYLLEKKLFGIAPFANDTVLFGLMPSWCGAAGQPTGFGVGCLIQPTNEPNWGVVFHEMGHDFTGHFLLQFVDGIGGTYPSHRDIFQSWADCCGFTVTEGIATLAQMYSIRHLVDDSQSYGISGSTLESLKKQLVFNNGYLNDLATYESSGNNFSTINANILDGMFINLANDKIANPYGWELYPKAFKIYLDPLPSFITAPLTEIQGHTYFIAGLSAAAGTDLRNKFKKWGFTVDDAYYEAIYPTICRIVNGTCVIPPSASWTQITQAGARTTVNTGKSGHFQFFSENEIYVLGQNGKIYKWTAGQNPSAQWEGPLTTSEITDIFFVTSDRKIYGLRLNGAIYRWDGSWTQITKEGARTTVNTGKSGHFQFFSENEIYVLEGDGAVHLWKGAFPDGSWSDALTTSQFDDIFYVTPERKIYVLGQDGAIRRWDSESPKPLGRLFPEQTHLLANIMQALKGIVDFLGKLP